MKTLTDYLEKMRGGKQSPPRAPFHEIFWSAIGGFLGIYAIYFIGHIQNLPLADNLFLVGSFGASAILIYGVPNSPFAQPRNLVGGHVLSAIVGVSCALLFRNNIALAAATAVSLALVVMHLSRTIHPPGGASALIAVIGSEHIHGLAYWYVLAPIASGVAIMLVLGLGWAAQSRINTAGKPLNCAETRTLLADYHNGALGAPTTTRVAKHLANCHSCRKHFENQFPGEARLGEDSPGPLAKHGPSRLLASR